MLVLSGLGGGGKTRLAIKLAENLATTFPDGVFFVDLAPLVDGTRVFGTVAQLFGVREETDKNLPDLVCAHLSGKQLMLVLDNCEHLRFSVRGTCRSITELMQWSSHRRNKS